MINKVINITKKNIKLNIFTLFIIYMFFFSNVKASTKFTGISYFPESYQVYLKALQKLHNNWTFTALNTELEWNSVIRNESASTNLNRSAVPSSYGDIWKWKNSNNKYNEIEPGWVTASDAAIKYTMDPRKYLNEMQIFQFETLNYDSTTQNQNGVEKIFYGTLMYDKNISYIDTNGKLQTINKTYSKVIMEAAAKYGVSPYHLASRIRQETACDIKNNTSIKGNVSGYIGLYNYFNIGSTGGDNPAISGLAYARKEGWITPELSINGGAKFLAEKYIGVGQYTTYLQKFNVNDNSNSALYTHQYQQNILAPSSESISIYTAYLKMNLLDIPFNFIIPVYDNMPNSPFDIYTQNANDFKVDSTKVYCTSNLNLRSGPGVGNSVILTIPKETVMTRIATGIQAGERWDKVRLETGLEGYVFQSYIKEYSYNKVKDVSINSETNEVKVGKTLKLNVNILPSNATYKDFNLQSSNSQIASVDDNGIVTGNREGSVVITATTSDQLKVATFVVNVIKREPMISLDKVEYNIIKGREKTIFPLISDSDILDYELTIEDENIAKIQGFKILGINEGETKITARIKGTDIKVESIVKVVELSEDILIDKDIRIDGEIFTNISPETRVRELKSKIQTIYDLVIKSDEGNILNDEDFIRTGTKVQLQDDKENIIYEYIILIYGDVDLDGHIFATDYVKIKNHIMGVKNISGIGKMAADVNHDNNIYANDYVIIKNYIMGNGKINQ